MLGFSISQGYEIRGKSEKLLSQSGDVESRGRGIQCQTTESRLPLDQHPGCGAGFRRGEREAGS